MSLPPVSLSLLPPVSLSLSPPSCLSVSQWGVVDELGKLPSLVKLLFHRNLLVTDDGNPRTLHQLLIARLAQLLVLNGVAVSGTWLVFFSSSAGLC